MKTEGKIWVLFNSVENKKTKPLSVVQMQMMLLTLKVSSVASYYIWTPGWDDWQSLSTFLASGQKYFVQTQPPSPLAKKQREHARNHPDEDKTVAMQVPEVSQVFTEVIPAETLNKADYGYYYVNFTGDDLTLSGAPEKPDFKIAISRKDYVPDSDRRRNKRHDFKIEAVLVTKKGTSFRTHSKNISMTGTLLEDEIPKDFFHRPFEMILINRSVIDPKRNRVHLTGRIVGDLSDPRRLVFVEQDDEVYQKLNGLISDYVEMQKQRIKKTAG